MYTDAPITTLKQINMIFKYFLWGFDQVLGQRKTPLVAWHKLTQPREKGGLDFIDCKMHVQAVLNKWVSKALLDPTTEWASLLLELTSDFTWDQQRAINRAQYSPCERVLLCSVHTCRSMPYTTCIWQAWEALCRHLILSPAGNQLPA